ncbi:transcriptional regulator NagR [Microbispora corallina]|uniref:HTH-type transcriptional repressor YvoA n=1 Tax=Microbispora corallina TaxID=83302 RepID=A0ABQ4G708_9ACTN|nr:GntR family transcriptional regulator [Microbispora corallina]GIH42802.1 HTH-type transcriptional repressor YvoA [Microbispora corallina]
MASTTNAGPKYDQVRAQLAERIRTDLRPGDALPSERELMEMFGISRMTVRKALAGLEAEGLVYRIHGSGTYVSETALVSKTLRLTSFSEDMRERGLRPGTRLLEAELVPATADVAQRLRLSPGTQVAHLRRLRLANQTPMALEEVYLPAELVPGLLDHDLSGSLYDVLDAAYGVRAVRARQVVQSTVVDDAQAELLEVPPRSPALIVGRVAVDARGRAVELGTTLYRGDRYAFDVTITREARS